MKQIFLSCLWIKEIIFDEYNYVDPLGKPSKENILSVNFSKKETFFGGCLPVAKNIAQICKLGEICADWVFRDSTTIAMIIIR